MPAQVTYSSFPPICSLMENCAVGESGFRSIAQCCDYVTLGSSLGSLSCTVLICKRESNIAYIEGLF